MKRQKSGDKLKLNMRPLRRKRKEYFNKNKKPELFLDEYTEGESGSEFTVKLRDLNGQAKLYRLMFLWRKVYTRARGGTRLI